MNYINLYKLAIYFFKSASLADRWVGTWLAAKDDFYIYCYQKLLTQKEPDLEGNRDWINSDGARCIRAVYDYLESHALKSNYYELFQDPIDDSSKFDDCLNLFKEVLAKNGNNLEKNESKILKDFLIAVAAWKKIDLAKNDEPISIKLFSIISTISEAELEDIWLRRAKEQANEYYTNITDTRSYFCAYVSSNLEVPLLNVELFFNTNCHLDFKEFNQKLNERFGYDNRDFISPAQLKKYYNEYLTAVKYNNMFQNIVIKLSSRKSISKNELQKLNDIL